MRPASFSTHAIITLLITLLACHDGSSPGNAAGRRDEDGSAGSGGRGQNVGVLQGDVYFVGVPCPLIYPPRPPCDGPFPGYEIIVFHTDDTTEAARARSDSLGFYRLVLAAGAYVIFTPRGIDSTIKRRNEARVMTDDTTRLDLLVDTGIR